MNWKQLIYTSAATLIVTVASGLAVNWYTKKSIDAESKNEKLVYEIQNGANFQTDSVRISLYTVIISNIGNEISNDVTLEVKFSNEANIIDVNGKMQRTKEILNSVKKLKNLTEFKIPSLYPDDIFILNIALSGIVSAPEIILQSAKSVGKAKSLKLDENEKSSNNTLISVLLAVIILIPVLYYLGRLYKSIGYDVTLNNTAFLFLHNNKALMAKELLDKQIKTKGATSHEFANLALAEFICNENDKSYENLLKMSEIIVTTKRGNLILTFNKLIISGKIKDYVAFKDLFKKCVSIEKSELKKYLKLSSIISDLKNDDPKINELLNELVQTNYA